jgi:AcrR family transcriptional regulator
MTGRPGLRERKKERTRRSLVEVSLRLFAEQGYDATTIDEIAATADVSRRTFFSYFPSKEEVLFSGLERRVGVVLRGIEERSVHEPLFDVLIHAAQEVTRHAWDYDPVDDDLGRIELSVITEVPSLQARALYRLSLAEEKMAEALLRAYPDELNKIMAAAVVGAVIRAGTAAAMTSWQESRSPEEMRTAMRQAVRVVGEGLRLAMSREGTGDDGCRM